MRAQLLGLSAVSLLFLAGGDCCGVGEPWILPREGTYECWGFDDCALAVGSEVVVEGSVGIIGASLDDPSRAGLELVEGRLVVRPTASGTLNLRVTLEDRSRLSTRLVIAPRSTTVVTSITPIGRASLSPGLPQVFAGTELDVFADHRDAANQQLLGSGLETWSITGGRFTAESGRRWRHVITGSDPKVIVSARPDGTPLEVDVVPARSTAHLDLHVSVATRLRDTGQLSLAPGETQRVYVWPFAANERYIFGVPAGESFTATSDNTQVMIVESVANDGRAFQLLALARGSANLTVGFDGITRTFRIDVD